MDDPDCLVSVLAFVTKIVVFLISSGGSIYDITVPPHGIHVSDECHGVSKIWTALNRQADQNIHVPKWLLVMLGKLPKDGNKNAKTSYSCCEDSGYYSEV